MQIDSLTLSGAFHITPRIHGDDRGLFTEYFRADHLAEHIGHVPRIVQGNCSVSAPGTLRGVHSAAVPPGQAKFVTCADGAVIDAVVDIRRGSPTFGRHELIELSSERRNAVYVPEGMGHAFFALTQATVMYLCTATYNPDGEFGINPLDPDLGIPWPTIGLNGEPLSPLLSPKDAAAPSLVEAEAAGMLPELSAVEAYLASLGS